MRVFEDSGTLRDGMTRRLVALAVVGVLACSPLMAYADPPDPTWIPGFWDDADRDDVIVRVTSTSSVAEPHAVGTLEPHWVPVWTVPVGRRPADSEPGVRPASAPRPSARLSLCRTAARGGRTR